VTTNPRGIDARQTPRFTVRLSAEVTHGGRSFTATTRDLSQGGVGLDAHQMVPEGELLQVTLFLVVDDVEDPSQPQLDVRGQVMWSVPPEEGRPGAMGIRFEGLSPAQQAGLARFLKVVGVTE
jgi:hypothetical protein